MKKVTNTPNMVIISALRVRDALDKFIEANSANATDKDVVNNNNTIAEMNYIIDSLSDYSNILSVDRLKAFIEINKVPYNTNGSNLIMLPTYIIPYSKLVDFVINDDNYDIDDKIESLRHPYINRYDFKQRMDNARELYTVDGDHQYIDVKELIKLIDNNTLGMTTKKSERLMEFKQSGLLWFVNSILQAFGWSIVYNIDDKSGNVVDLDIRRVYYRGFAEKSNNLGYARLSDYMKNKGADLYHEAYCGLNSDEKKEFLKDRYVYEKGDNKNEFAKS